MPAVNPTIIKWARETAGLTIDEAVRKLGINDTKVSRAADRLAELESGAKPPTRPMLVKMAKQYRRPLLTFYLSDVPRKGDRGQDFRTLPEGHDSGADADRSDQFQEIQNHYVAITFAAATKIMPMFLAVAKQHTLL